MVFTSRYWQLVTLTSAGNKRLCDIDAVRDWGTERVMGQLGADLTSDRELQTYLWNQWHAGGESALLARLSLRCWISHQIARACYQLASQFGKKYGFTTAELWPLVLDDDGRLDMTYPALSLKILERYDPERAALSTWANRMTLSHSEINRFCLERGLYRISPWALLNDTSVSRMKRDLVGLGQGALSTKAALLQAYHEVYRRDRLSQRAQLGRTSRCQEPTPEQLLKISHQLGHTQPTSTVLNQLTELADQLREHRISVRQGSPPTRPIETINEYGSTGPENDDAEQSQGDFLQRYRAHFIESLDGSIEAITQGYAASYQRKQPPKDQLFLSALRLFHCDGLGMGAIAQKIGLTSQVQVTRLLKLKRFRTEVCAHWLNTLKQQVNAAALKHISPERLTQIAQQIEQILTEETGTVISEAAAEAQIAKGRETKSTFARRLCATLPTFKSLKQKA